MKDVIGSLARQPARFQIADIALDHPEARGFLESRRERIIEIGPMAGREVIEPDDVLAEGEKLLQQVGADETGSPGDNPGSGSARQMFAKLGVACVDHELTLAKVPATPNQGKHVREHAYPSNAPHPRLTSLPGDEASSIPPSDALSSPCNMLHGNALDLWPTDLWRLSLLLCRGMTPFLW
jgi:hypothetical protein